MVYFSKAKLQYYMMFSFVFVYRIRFTIVSEPPEELDDGDCEDVGVAFVSVRDILQNRKDITDADVPSEFIC